MTGKRAGYENTCIERRGLGFTEYITFEEWVNNVVQDEQVAIETAERWLRTNDGADEFPWNEDAKPGYYEEWLITDLPRFKRDLKRLTA